MDCRLAQGVPHLRPKIVVENGWMVVLVTVGFMLIINAETKLSDWTQSKAVGWSEFLHIHLVRLQSDLLSVYFLPFATRPNQIAGATARALVVTGRQEDTAS